VGGWEEPTRGFPFSDTQETLYPLLGPESEGSFNSVFCLHPVCVSNFQAASELRGQMVPEERKWETQTGFGGTSNSDRLPQPTCSCSLSFVLR